MILATDITIPQAFALSGIAMLIIMAVLSSIMGLIHLVALILKKLDEFLLKRENKKKTSNQIDSVSEDNGVQHADDSLNLLNVEDDDAAMIMAIVADNTGIPLNELRFKSIKRIDLGGENQ